MKKNPFQNSLLLYRTPVFSAALVMAACLAIAPASRAGIVLLPTTGGESGVDLWADLRVEAWGSPGFNPNGGSTGGSWIRAVDQWSGSSYPANFHILVREERRFDPDLHFEVKSQAGFNAAGLIVLKNYLKVSGPALASGTPDEGDEPELEQYRAYGYANASHEGVILAPEGFWEAHDSYRLRHEFVVNGILSKSANITMNIEIGTSEGSWTRYYDEDAGEMNNFLLSEMFVAQHDPGWGDSGATPGHFGLMQSVWISIYADNTSSGFSAEADLFNTTRTSTITLLAEDGEGNWDTIVTFDSMGKVIHGNPNFSLVTPVPEPSSFALFFGFAVLLMTVARRFLGRSVEADSWQP